MFEIQFRSLHYQNQLNKKFNDTWLRIIGIPVLALVSLLITNYDELIIKREISSYTVYYLGVLVFFIAVIWHLNLLIHFKVRKHYEQLNNKRKFIIGWMVRLLLYGVNTVIIIFCGSLILRGNETSATILAFQFLQTISFALLFTYVVMGFYETRYFIFEWGKSYSEAEEIKKLNLQIQVDSLRSQINPHFLFNSLNTLSALVSSDHLKAEKFIDQMSAIYRYVLFSNEKQLVTVEEELAFIDDYFDLLKTRYEDGLQFRIDIDEAYLAHLMPPLTLQLLVENAVKHNVVSTANPLYIRIYTDELQQLVIENTVRQKTTPVQTNKMGLSNIFAKYKLLNQPQLIINQTAKLFQVVLSLIPPLSKEITVKA